jgi:colanic acid/amylovoran biosynthesis glycosyltransferase
MEQTRIAYVISQYPAVSHTFIRREIIALERQGLYVIRIALRSRREIVDPEDLQEQERTRYLLEDGLLPLLSATLVFAVRRPMRFVAALRVALRFTRRTDRPPFYHFAYLAEACRLLPWLSKHHVRHVHAHFGANAAEVALFAHLLSGVSYSFTVHGPEEFDKPEFIRLPEKIIGATFVVAVSSFCRGQLLRWVNAAYWPNIKVVHCGVDRRFLDDRRPPGGDCKRLVCVGRLSGQKGQTLLLSAASDLVRQGVEFELVLAGDGEMRAAIEDLIVAHRLSAIVRITGWISNDQVRDEILAARALVLPSLAEGLPVVIMEAMALQRPVLATYVAGIPELIRHGEEGWLFPAGSVDELAAAMRECLEAPASEIARMGLKARARVAERHNIDNEAKKLAELFHAAVKGPNRQQQVDLKRG